MIYAGVAALLALAEAMAVSAMVGEYRDGRLEARQLPRASVLALFVAALVVAALAAVLWHSSEVAAEFAAWSEAVLPAWLDWLV